MSKFGFAFISVAIFVAQANAQSITREINEAAYEQREAQRAQQQREYQSRTLAYVSALVKKHGGAPPASHFEPICGTRPSSLSPTNPRDVTVVVGYSVELTNGNKCSLVLDQGEGKCLRVDRSVQTFRFQKKGDSLYGYIGRNDAAECRVQ